MAVIDARRPSHEDVTKIPTPPLQAVGLFINFFFPILALTAVALRFYARHMLRQLAIDDWFLLAALCFSLAMVVPFYFYIKLNYFGWRAYDVPDFDPSPGRWWFYLAQIFYNPVLALVKASVLLFLLRLGGHRRAVRYFIYGLLAFNGLQAIAVFLVAVFQCIPIEANWDPAVAAHATCIHPSFHVIVSSITLATDLLVLIIPFWIFVDLKLPFAARLAIIGAFLTGLAVTIIGGVRLSMVYKLFFVPKDPNRDPYYNIGITLNSVEINLAIVSGAVPGLRPLFRKWFPRWFGGGSKKYVSGGRGYKSGNDYTGAGNRIRSGMMSGTESGLPNGHGGIALKNLAGRSDKSRHTEIRSTSPSGSEEEIMTSNGIMRTTDVHIHYGSETFYTTESRTSSDFKAAEAGTNRAS